MGEARAPSGSGGTQAAPQRASIAGAGEPARWLEPVDLLLFLVSVAVYLTALPNDFTQDDLYYLVESEEVRERAWVLFFQPFRDSGVYRPFTFLTLGANHAVGGLAPFGYHLVNVLLHGAVVVLLYRVLRRLAAGASAGAAGDAHGATAGIASFLEAPFAAALLFAVHPIHTEAVAAVVGRAELLSAAFVLSAWLLHLADRRWLAAAAFLLALFAKEPAVAFLGLVPLGDFVRGTRLRVARYAPYAVAFATYAGLRWFASGPPDMSLVVALENPLVALPQPWRILNALAVAWRVVLLQLYPATLSADYSFDSIALSRDFAALLPALLATVAALAAWLWSARAHRRVFLAGGIYLAGFAVTSNVPFLIPTILGERLAYLPSAGLCLLAGLAIEALARRRRLFALGVLAAASAALAVRTIVRNRDWQDNATLARATVAAVPDNAKWRLNLGVILLGDGDLAGARENLERAHAIDPDYPDALDSLAVVHYQQADLAGAIRLAREAVAKSSSEHPKRVDFSVNLAGFLIEAGEFDAALAILDRLIADHPDAARAYANRAVLAVRRGDWAAARRDLQAAVRLDPGDEASRRLLVDANARLAGSPTPP